MNAIANFLFAIAYKNLRLWIFEEAILQDRNGLDSDDILMSGPRLFKSPVMMYAIITAKRAFRIL